MNSNIRKQNSSKNDRWGDSLGIKNENNIRISFQNVNGFLPKDEDNAKIKIRNVHDFIKDNNIDVHAMVEMNVRWSAVPKDQTINELSRGWFETQRVSCAYNLHDKICGKHQPGGAAIVTQGEMALRWIETKYDKHNMGRWVSQLFRGKRNLKLRVVSVYFATAQKEHGRKKIYMQQKLALLKLHRKESVYEAFWHDFFLQVDEWRSNGEQLVIGGDWNMDVRKENFLQGFTDRNLIPSNITRHGRDGPGTYCRGNLPIDEIFISTSIKITACGYLPNGEAAGDHRPIWIDICKTTALGTKLNDIASPQARRLKCKDPRIVKRYNDVLLETLRSNNFFTRLYTLYNEFETPLTTSQIWEMEDLDLIRTNAMILAEKNVVS